MFLKLCLYLRQLYYPTFLLWQVQRNRHPASTLVGQIVKATAIEVVKDLAEVAVKVGVVLPVKGAAKELVRAAKESAEVVRVVLELVAAHVNLVAEEVIDFKNKE